MSAGASSARERRGTAPPTSIPTINVIPFACRSTNSIRVMDAQLSRRIVSQSPSRRRRAMRPDDETSALRSEKFCYAAKSDFGAVLYIDLSEPNTRHVTSSLPNRGGIPEMYIRWLKNVLCNFIRQKRQHINE